MGLTARRPKGPRFPTFASAAVQWQMAIAAGFVEREGRHLYDSLVFCAPDGTLQIYRKRNLVFWERFRFHPGRSPLVVATPWGRVGFAICADMIYRKVWNDYRGRIDLAVVSAAWPDFADRESGRRHWLFGHVGPLSGAIPAKVAMDLGVPVIFANQCGETRTTIPVLGTQISDRFAGQSSICDGRHGEPVRAGRETAASHCPHHPPPATRYEIVAFYVPLGPRGLLFRIGTFVIGIWGGLVYGRASRRRGMMAPSHQPLTVSVPD